MHKLRHYENLHIPLWLLKDTCWMLQWKTFGIVMIFPTIIVAAVITVKCWRQKDDEFWINLATCFWIAANSYWMLCEFSHHEEIKNYAAIPFIAGMICVTWFYIKRLLLDKKNNTIF
ncbi:MAG: hypothetical protein K0S44_594 [Bacteroidetes bacterium]|jgi:hypothetical protein|nr:hypothetical protein [Bacteroidota bacterium]